MRFSTIAVALAGATSSIVIAAPAMLARQTALCSGLNGTPQCCATDVLGVADLDCANRELPTGVDGARES
jgi:Fungal hydrophobin